MRGSNIREYDDLNVRKVGYNDGKDRLLKPGLWSNFTGNLIEAATNPAGEIIEIDRNPGGDCNHASLNVNPLILSAEILWHQNVDLYDQEFEGDSRPRVYSVAEYFAKAKTDPPIQTTYVGDVSCSTASCGSEVANNHYKHRMDDQLPVQDMDESVVAARSGSYITPPASSGYIPWSTLTHAELSK